MNVAGIDGHARYLVVTVLNNMAKMLHAPVRIKNAEVYRLVELLEPLRPLEAVVETSPAWPWLYDLLVGHGFGFATACHGVSCGSRSAVLTRGGLRGGISMLLALSLPVFDAPHLELIITITFGVVVLTILVNGLTMAPLLRMLGIGSPQRERVQYEVARGELQGADGALAERTELRDEEARRASRHLTVVEKGYALDAYHRGVIGQEALEEVLRDLDARLGELGE